MEQITTDEVLLNRLNGLNRPLEFRDPKGKLLGTFRPAADPAQYLGLEPGISEEEIRRREKSDKWYTTAQVLERLRQLENQ